MFKVGDAVKRTRGGFHGMVAGAVYTVDAVSPSGHWLGLAGAGKGGRDPTPFWYEYFELVEPAPTSRSTDPTTSKGKRKVNKYELAVLTALRGTLYGLPTTSDSLRLTGKEIAASSNYPLNCITPRFAPLRRKGLIKDSGSKRDKQIVWVLA